MQSLKATIVTYPRIGPFLIRPYNYVINISQFCKSLITHIRKYVHYHRNVLDHRRELSHLSQVGFHITRKIIDQTAFLSFFRRMGSLI